MGRMGSRLAIVAVLAFAFSSIVLPVANAYIDPGSGSFIVQMAIGAILGLSFTIKMFWRRLVSLFTGRKGRDPQEEKQTPEQ